MKIHTLISMGDVLPPKRQTVVERLKRRFAHYRQHQNACLPRYEQAANGLYETQRQDTLLLKQRYLESKAKKAKSKSDHHRTYKEPSSDVSKSQLHSKSLKRSADDALSNATPEAPTMEDTEKPAKIQCTEAASEKPLIKTDIPLQKQANQPSLSSFSVQIVQQFSQSSLAQNSQTIQTNVTVQALPKPLQSPVPQQPTTQELPVSNPDDHLQTVVTTSMNNVECKQEKDTGDSSDLCQFKNNQATNSVSSVGDRLSDTFPSIEFTDESGEAVLHPDILNDLIEDVFTNSADIMKDFNFEDSVGSLKDQEEATKEIIETLKSSSPAQMRSFDNLPFAAATANNQQNSLFKNIPSSNESPGSTMTSITTSAVTSSTTSFYNSASVPQRLQSFNNSSLPLQNGMSLDFKLSEPSPAALTLKQLAEQHQNMQQKQQLSNSPLNNRSPSFNQSNFATHMRPSNNLNAPSPTVQNFSPKMLNTGQQMFNAFDQRLNSFQSPESAPNFPAVNCDTMSPNNMFGSDVRSRNSADSIAESEVRALRMKLSGQQQKPPVYATSQQPMTLYAGNPTRHQAPVPGQQQQRPSGRQFQNNPGMRLQMSQVQQVQPPRQQHAQQMSQESHDIKQQLPMMQQPHPNSMYNNYSPQQSVGNSPFHVPMSQPMQFSPQFTSNSAMNRPPPEYKVASGAHHRADNLHIVEQLNAPSQAMFNQQTKNKYIKQQQQQRSPNVTITPDGDWRANMMNNGNLQQQQPQFRGFNPQDNFGNLNSNSPVVSQNIPLSPIYSQFRMPSNQIPTNRPMVRPDMGPPNHMMHQQRQRLNISQQQPLRNPSMEQQHNSLTMNSSPMNSNNMMGSMYSEHQEMDRQDGSHLSLDFLDNIESSASDLLNFDQVMQSGTHYPNLDDILGK